MSISIQNINPQDIWLVRLNDAEQYEMMGTRPVVVIAVHTQANQVMCAPCSSVLASRRFAYSHQMAPSPQNGLTQVSIVKVYQTRTLSLSRFIRKMGEADDADFESVKTLLKDYCHLDD